MPEIDVVERLRNRLVRPRLGAALDRAPVIGLCGAQGSGKSTAAAVLGNALLAEGLSVAVLSLDDFYLPRAARLDLARSVHPLLATRGVPGTHDVELAIATVGALTRREAAALPRFDKAIDEPVDQSARAVQPEGTDVVLFEGWCLGARAQDMAELEAPVNELEATEDPDGRWRRFVNMALAGPYQALFAQLDALALLAAPSFEQVISWRQQQEHELRRRLAAEAQPPGRTMTDAEVTRFVRHYERLTRHILATMPAYADLVIELDADRRPLSCPV